MINSLTLHSVGVSTGSRTADLRECKGQVSRVTISAAAAVRLSLAFEVCCLEASGEEDLKEFIARKQQTKTILICFLFPGFCCL